MDAYESAKSLNDALANAEPEWGNLDLWDDFTGLGELHLHKLLSSLVAVIGEDHVVWQTVNLDIGEDTADTTSYEVTLWTGSLVVRASRSGGDQWPLVSVTPRSALTAFDVLRVPVITTSALEASNYRSTALRLTYPTFTVDLRDRGGGDLKPLLPSFIADLEAVRPPT